jgi:predicted RNA-binding Zn-ribbon protein involved in translation (DUF1610 family)
MKSTRKALRDDDIFKDTYERLNCTDCEKVLKTTTDSDTVFDLRTCPECGTEYKDLR